MLQNIYISKNAVFFLNFPFIKILIKNLSQFSQKCEAAQLFSTLMIINVFWATIQHVRMISEGSRDTEDWSNDAEN